LRMCVHHVARWISDLWLILSCWRHNTQFTHCRMWRRNAYVCGNGNKKLKSTSLLDYWTFVRSEKCCWSLYLLRIHNSSISSNAKWFAQIGNFKILWLAIVSRNC
jgi:hypothetical protein